MLRASSRRGEQRLSIFLEGTDNWAPAKPRLDQTLIRAPARALQVKRLPEDGTCRSAAELAEAEKIARSYITRLLQLTLLAPAIREAILDGRQPNELQLKS